MEPKLHPNDPRFVRCEAVHAETGARCERPAGPMHVHEARLPAPQYREDFGPAESGIMWQDVP